MRESLESDTYGPYAAIYNRIWGPRLVDMVVPPLEELLLRHMPPGAEAWTFAAAAGRSPKP